MQNSVLVRRSLRRIYRDIAITTKSSFVDSFALICFQRLSELDLATPPCRGRDNGYTRGPCIPVLSY